jgi:aconitate hydratase A / 2-methylisocitrate dehydratase
MNSFGAKSSLPVAGTSYEIFRLDALKGRDISRLPYSLKILLENLLRFEDGKTVTKGDIEALASWDPKAAPSREIAFRPARVLMQDFTGVPAVVDLAAMREAMKAMGGQASRINPLQPAELVIDHSVQVDRFGSNQALQLNSELEYQRNRERYQFLKWGQQAFQDFKVVPPETGIVHQVNLEYLARVVFTDQKNGKARAYPDTLVGTDSHTTMINGLGVLGWGVGGIEAEAGMLGQPVSMLIPQVVGFKLTGKLAEGATATDLVLTVTEMLRKKGVVGKFVEFYGDGLGELPLAERATIANMAPEYGATCGLFPIDKETLVYLRLTGRSDEQVALVEAYARAQGMFREAGSPEAAYTDSLHLDMGDVEPSLAGPRRPQDRVPLKSARQSFETALSALMAERQTPSGAAAARNSSEQTEDPKAAWASEGGATAVAVEQGPQGVKVTIKGAEYELRHGSVVIAAITSCTNTSNPAVMLGAGLVAKKAVERGLQSQPWVKTSLAPGSKVVTEYLNKSGLTPYLDLIGFNLVGYGCTTCIGNSGPLPPEISEAIREGNLAVAAVLSGNRNFEGRVHAEVRMNYLASPPLVVAYALAGRMDIDLTSEPLGVDLEGKPVYLKDLWPSPKEVQETIASTVDAEMFRRTYSDVFTGDHRWSALGAEPSDLFDWDGSSTYIRRPPYFTEMGVEPDPVSDILGARVLALLGDSVTTDHISPAGSIKPDSPAGKYLIENGIQPADFNSYGSRRGNHEVMMRGTFANVRLRNRLAPGTEGGWTQHLPDGEQMTIYDAAMKYQEEKVPLVVLAGKEYGSGSSRDWAAKGPRLLGVRAAIAESYERIHRSNLIGMGVLPLEFPPGKTAESLGLTGREVYDITGLGDGSAKEVTVTAKPDTGDPITFKAKVRIDTPQEVLYYQHGGILQYVLRQMVKNG